MVNVLQSRGPVQAPDRVLPGEEKGLYYRVATELPKCDPWALADVLRRPGETLVQWQQNDFAFVAIGSVAEMAFEGPRRFQVADSWVRAFMGRMLSIPEDERLRGVPLFVGGFSFSNTISPELTGPWLGWRPSLLRVPRLVVFRRGDRYGAVVTERLRVAQQPVGRKEKLREELLEALTTPQPTFDHQAQFSPSDNSLRRRNFIAQVGKALGEIQSHESPNALAKVVLSRRATYRAVEAIDSEATLRRLRDTHPGCVTFSFDQGIGRRFIGATPELLARKTGRNIDTKALAGTYRNTSPGSAHALLSSEKDQREHAYVVQAICEALAPISEAVTSASGPHLRSLRDIAHLETTIMAQTRPDTSLLQAIEQLHPTPAVGGTPRRAACDFIAAQEADERGWYTGPIGWVDALGDGEFHVALRCGVVEGRHAWAFAGAGIVDGSEADSEWDETNAKLGAFRASLGPVEGDA